MLGETENRNKTQNIIDWGGMGGQFSVAIKKLEIKHGNRKNNGEEREKREKREREKERKDREREKRGKKDISL